jgi:hypothetical protein
MYVLKGTDEGKRLCLTLFLLLVSPFPPSVFNVISVSFYGLLTALFTFSGNRSSNTFQ